MCNYPQVRSLSQLPFSRLMLVGGTRQARGLLLAGRYLQQARELIPAKGHLGLRLGLPANLAG